MMDLADVVRAVSDHKRRLDALEKLQKETQETTLRYIDETRARTIAALAHLENGMRCAPRSGYPLESLFAAHEQLLHILYPTDEEVAQHREATKRMVYGP